MIHSNGLKSGPFLGYFWMFLTSTVKKKKWDLGRMAREFTKEKVVQWEGRRLNIGVARGEHTTFLG